jgi:hypothetical protein
VLLGDLEQAKMAYDECQQLHLMMSGSSTPG